MKPIRYTPPNTFWFIGNRCFQAQFLMRPDDEMKLLFGYWLGRALRVHPGIELIAAVQMSNHFHFVLKDVDSELSRFLGYFEAHLATSINRLRNRSGAAFQTRFFSSPILDEAAVAERVLYTVLNPIQAKLVREPDQWPGILLSPKTTDQRIEFTLFDHAKKRHDQQRGIQRENHEYERTESIKIAGRPDATKIADKIQEGCIAIRKTERNKGVLGIRKLKAQDPFENPDSPKKSRRPVCYAESDVLKDNFKALMKRIRALHADASAAFRYGKTDIKFPQHTFCSFRFCPD